MSSSNIKFSLIVPVYNIENYIEKCIDSILKQTYNNFELIIVNDGSTDSSLNKISRFTDDRIKILNKENGGLSSARNYGLKYVTGDYIWFVDGDDYISENALQDFYAILNKDKFDIIMFKSYIEKNGNITIPKERYFNNTGTKCILSPVSAWSKIFNTAFFIENNFNFIDGRIYEDLEVIPFIISKTDSIFFLDKPEYYYVQREGSIMNSNKSFKGNRDDKFVVLDNLINKFKQNNTFEQYKNELEYLIIRHLVLVFSTEILIFPQKIYKQRCEKVLSYLKDYNVKWEKNIYLKESPITSRVFVKLFKYKRYKICSFIVKKIYKR